MAMIDHIKAPCRHPKIEFFKEVSKKKDGEIIRSIIFRCPKCRKYFTEWQSTEEIPYVVPERYKQLRGDGHITQKERDEHFAAHNKFFPLSAKGDSP